MMLCLDGKTAAITGGDQGIGRAIAERLATDGADVAAYDPVAEDQARSLVSGIDFAPSALEAASGADAIFSFLPVGWLHLKFWVCVLVVIVQVRSYLVPEASATVDNLKALPGINAGINLGFKVVLAITVIKLVWDLWRMASGAPQRQTGCVTVL